MNSNFFSSQTGTGFDNVEPIANPEGSPAVGGGEKLMREELQQECAADSAKPPRKKRRSAKYLKGQLCFAGVFDDGEPQGGQNSGNTAVQSATAENVRSFEADIEDRGREEVAPSVTVPVDSIKVTKVEATDCFTAESPSEVSSITSGAQYNHHLPTMTVSSTPLPSVPTSALHPVSLGGVAVSTDFESGGYDGGLAIGWEGIWDVGQFAQHIATLKAAKQQAQDAPTGERVQATLGNTKIMVYSSGTKIGNNNWWYKFQVFGVTFLLHQNPHNPQQVRATYGSEALITNTLPALHAKVLKFLSPIGLSITKETLTRVDM